MKCVWEETNYPDYTVEESQTLQKIINVSCKIAEETIESLQMDELLAISRWQCLLLLLLFCTKPFSSSYLIIRIQ